MTEQDFDFIRKLLRDRVGIVLEPGKEYLVESRLEPIVRELKLHSITNLVHQLRKPSSNGELQTRIVEAMLTTETFFFRDQRPFDALRDVVLPDLIHRRHGTRRLHFWCAACATGQEPYSLAILLREHFPELARWDVTLLATDCSRQALARAVEGRYHRLEVNRGLSPELLSKYFEQRNDGTYQVRADLRRGVKFEEMNLAQRWPRLPHMDLVLLRNVMIYFDVETRRSILGHIARVLKPDGYLLLGNGETTLNLVDAFRRAPHLKSGFFQLNPAP